MIGSITWLLDIEFRARFHYKCKMDHYSFVLLIFLLLFMLEIAKSTDQGKKIHKRNKEYTLPSSHWKQALHLQKKCCQQDNNIIVQW